MTQHPLGQSNYGACYRHGWYQVAFERDLTEPLTPVHFADRRLIAVKQSGAVRIVDASCPHRGAHLAIGGRLDNEAIICPFHGYRIKLGACDDPLHVREYPSFVSGGMVFVALSDDNEVDLASALRQLEPGHVFVSGFTLQTTTSIEMVMENGFDNAHFKSVHGLLRDPVFSTRRGDFGELVVEGDFTIPGSEWNQNSTAAASVTTAYKARAFSPGVVIAELAGEPPYNYKIITTAVPNTGTAGSTIRLSLALPNPADGELEQQKRFAQALLDVSKEGLEKDKRIWDNLDLSAPKQWISADQSVREFATFCERFRDAVR